MVVLVVGVVLLVKVARAALVVSAIFVHGVVESEEMVVRVVQMIPGIQITK